ncbi:Tap42 interacting protein [Teratosphaeriaceae sp. CCFEE 6253]|nr:Tap42 interacting protein [Teratosphaeriaceae sp. CCFEE 6253]
MTSNRHGAQATESDPGVQSTTTYNGTWRITTRKLPILKAEPIETLSHAIGIPIPEMIFGDNYVSITHIPSAWSLQFNARDALDRVSKTEEGMLQVAVAEDWKKDREGREEVRQVVKPFDWSYSTDYRGTTDSGQTDRKWEASTQQTSPVRTDLLSRPDPILFFDTVDLYEDELADNGIALLSVKVRVMPERLLLLSRFFLRLDGVLIRIRDTRVYVEHAGKRVVRQYTAKEEKYDVVKEKLRTRGENATEALRDANVVAALLRTVVDETDVFEDHVVLGLPASSLDTSTLQHLQKLESAMAATNIAGACEREARELRSLLAGATKVSHFRDEGQRRTLLSAVQQYIIESLRNPGDSIHPSRLRDIVLHFGPALDPAQRISVARMVVESALNTNEAGVPSMSTRIFNRIAANGRENFHRERAAAAAAVMQTSLTEKQNTVATFPFMKLPPELRNHVYELCMSPGTQYNAIPGACGCYQKDTRCIRAPPITETCRQIRTEALPVFYICTDIEHHVRRTDFSRLFAHCKSIRAWGVKRIGSIDIRLAEMSINSEVVMVRCGEGLWNLFKWVAIGATRTQFTTGNVDGPTPAAVILPGAVKRATDCRAEGMTDENELRSAFDAWLQMLDLTCRCKTSEWHGDNGVWYACSRSAPAGSACVCVEDYNTD